MMTALMRISPLDDVGGCKYLDERLLIPSLDRIPPRLRIVQIKHVDRQFAPCGVIIHPSRAWRRGDYAGEHGKRSPVFQIELDDDEARTPLALARQDDPRNGDIRLQYVIAYGSEQPEHGRDRANMVLLRLQGRHDEACNDCDDRTEQELRPCEAI